MDALEQRSLALINAAPSFNVLLNGTVATDLVVTSTDANPAYATNVTVAGGGYTLGALTVQLTEVDSVNPTDIPLTGTFTGSGYDGTFTGSGYTTKAIASGRLPVVTAEQASVGDTKAYRGLSVGYTANVGFATADANPSGLTDFSTATTLTSFVAPGTAMKNLELTVASGGKAVGMAADVITTPASLNTPTAVAAWAKTLDGLVGSTATIVTSDPVAAGATVSMQWCARVTQEIGDGPSPPLPAGSKYLTSDVVQISGLGSDTTGTVYALEMTFDNRVNVCLDGETNGTLQHEEPGLFIGSLVNGQWTAPSGTNETPPVAGATTFLGTPLSTFLSEEAAKGVSLDSLVGDWGVDGSLVPSTQATYRLGNCPRQRHLCRGARTLDAGNVPFGRGGVGLWLLALPRKSHVCGCVRACRGGHQLTGKLDLYYRLNVVRMITAPLRERPEDIQPLCAEFLDRLAIESGLGCKRLSAAWCSGSWRRVRGRATSGNCKNSGTSCPFC